MRFCPVPKPQFTWPPAIGLHFLSLNGKVRTCKLLKHKSNYVYLKQAAGLKKYGHKLKRRQLIRVTLFWRHSFNPCIIQRSVCVSCYVTEGYSGCLKCVTSKVFLKELPNNKLLWNVLLTMSTLRTVIRSIYMFLGWGRGCFLDEEHAELCLNSLCLLTWVMSVLSSTS
jgi:hypothetical protein